MKRECKICKWLILCYHVNNNVSFVLYYKKNPCLKICYSLLSSRVQRRAVTDRNLPRSVTGPRRFLSLSWIFVETNDVGFGADVPDKENTTAMSRCIP